MKRREFIALVGAAAAWPFTTRAQTVGKIPEVGFLYRGSASALPARIEAVLDGLRQKGYVDGRNISLVTRSAELRADQFEPLAVELVQRNVRVLRCSPAPTR